MSAADALKMIQESKAKFIDFRFTDTKGKEQHVSVPASVVNEEMFEEGKMFDGWGPRVLPFGKPTRKSGLKSKY